MTVTPASAAELPQLVRAAPAHADEAPVFDIENSQTAEHRRYRRYRYRRGPDAGDVIAGVLIIGAIAAAADRASRRDRDRDYRDRDYRDRDYRDRDYPDYRRDDVRYDDGRGIDRAVRMCIDRVERDTRVETVDRVDRTARGWQVEGTIFNGDAFTCTIGENGRIRDIDYGDRDARYIPGDEDLDDDFARADVEDRQWDDDRYAAERARIDGGIAADAGDAQAAYPGGPIEGEDEVDGDLEIGTGYPGA
ncbi:hypothetical protein [Qipengyuania aquimaris]|uniref:Uncharacterized protein n=1 Tax=Qipengyuania aquimaris TaxID=255984 RepID=A0A9Q3S0I0_9SPHN|nr:hypothetical protein [Qipengyuania aquimaris]MBY6217964.1 hypothetical protein [Qipengyuania aquimaris]